MSILRLFFEIHVFSNDNNLVSKNMYYHSCENNSNNNIVDFKYFLISTILRFFHPSHPHPPHTHPSPVYLTMINSLINILVRYPTSNNLAIAQFADEIFLIATIWPWRTVLSTFLWHILHQIILRLLNLVIKYSLLPLFLWHKGLYIYYVILF